MRKETSRLVVSVLVLIISIAFSIPAFAVPDDSIVSSHIAEADGTSGQDTNSGNGIKTGHIQDGAVTDAKIAGPISGSKIGSHSHSGEDITTGTIGIERLQTYKNVLIVHKGNADGVNTFNTIGAVLASISDASADNPYIVKVMPGVYNESIVMKEWVSIKGAGRNATRISTSSTPGVLGASNASLEDLFVEVLNSSTQFNAALKIVNTSPTIRNCTLRVPYYHDARTVTIDGGSPLIENCTVLHNSHDQTVGILIQGNSTARIVNTTVSLDPEFNLGQSWVCGIYLLTPAGADVQIDNSRILNPGTYPSKWSVWVYNGGPARVSSSMLDGVVMGNVKVVNSFDPEYNPVPNQ